MGVVLVCTPESQAPTGIPAPWLGGSRTRPGCREGRKGGREVLSLPPAEASLAICGAHDGFQQSGLTNSSAR